MLAEILLLAHSWYPEECCNQKDCYVVELVRYDNKPGDPGYIIKDGMVEVFIPKSFPRRNSHDGDYHLCYNQSAYRLYHDLQVYCFFIPGMA